MTRISLTVVGLAAALAAPLAWAQPVAFEAPRLSPREASGLRAPVIIDEAAFSRRLDQLATEIEALARATADDPKGGRGGRGRGRGRDADPARSARAALTELRAELRKAIPVVVSAPRPDDRRGPPGRPGDHRGPPDRPGDHRGPPDRPGDHRGPPDHRRDRQPAPVAASAETYASLLGAIDAGSFSEDKLRAVRRAAEHHHFTCAQVVGIARQLAFGADRIEAIVTLHPRLVDPDQIHLFDGALDHASERATLEERLKARPR